MIIARIMLPLVCSVPVLLGCTTTVHAPQKEATAMTVQPLLRIRHSSSTAQDFYQLGRYYQGQNRLELAADAYRKALENHKDYIEAHNALGTVYSSQGKLDAAIAEFESILKIAPQLAHLYNNLGYTYYLQNNFAKAISAFEKASALEPRNPRTYNNLGLVYRKMGNPEKSQLAFSRAADLNNSNAITGAPVAATAAPVAAARITDIADSAPSIALQPPSPPTSLPLAGERSDGGRYPTSTLTIVSPAVTLPAPTSLALKIIDSTNWSTKGVLSASNGAVSALVPLAAAPQIADSVAAADKVFQLEIANGNGVTGMARKVRAMLVQQGLPTSHLINLKPYRTPETTIQYRSGFRDEALRLSQTLTKPPTLVSNDHLHSKADVQLVLGKDAISTMALFHTGSAALKMAKKVAPQDDAG